MSDVRFIFLAHISINDIRYDFNGKNQREYMYSPNYTKENHNVRLF